MNLPLLNFQANKRSLNISGNFKQSADIVLFHGDTVEFLKEIPDEMMQLVITSPPYNLGKEYEIRTTIQEYLNSQKNIIKEIIRVLSPCGSICWQVGNFVQDTEVYPLDIFYYQIFKDLGLKLRNRIIWHFEHGLHCSKRFSGRYETILWFTKSDNYTFNLDNVRIPAKYPGKRHFKGPNKGLPSGNPLGKNPSDVWNKIKEEWESGFWEIPNVKANHPEKTLHPCQFPIELVERCILALSSEQDWIFDPFSGAGSTLIAALKNNRKSAGSEKEESYINITRERINSYENGNLKIRSIGKSVYTPTGKEKISQIPSEWGNANKEFQLLETKGNT